MSTEKLHAALRQIECKFKSGNSIPVERATVSAEEWAPIAEALSAHAADQAEPLTDTYVQQIPDKCDRILWRNRYYALPLSAAAQPAHDPSRQEDEAWLLIHRKREALLSGKQEPFDPTRMPPRNEEGFCWHPDLPDGMELDAAWQMRTLGFEADFLPMEADAEELYARYGDSDDLSAVAEWEPTEPGNGWRLAAIYDTEDGPHAMFVRPTELTDSGKPQPADIGDRESFQARVQPWMMACFGAEIAGDEVERGDRLLEEVLEWLQSRGYDPARVAPLRDYVFSRSVGESFQEAGGVMVTLAAHCLAAGVDMHDAAEVELARIWTKVEQIRAKQAAKPRGSALPVAAPQVQQQDAPKRITREDLESALLVEIRKIYRDPAITRTELHIVMAALQSLGLPVEGGEG